LKGPRELRHAESAEGAARRGVRVHGLAAERDVRYAVRPRRRVRALLDDARTDIRIGADVEVTFAGRGEEQAIAPEPEADRHARVAAAHGAERFLGAER